MASFIVKIFPLCAVLISVLACTVPQIFSSLGFMIIPLLGIIMAGMGATLSVGDFINAAKKPKSVCIGIVLQFVLMPFLAFVIGHALKLPKEQFIGLVMVGTVAGGTASNVIAYLSGGDVALSITMTACSTVAGIVLTPLISLLYLGQTVHVPAWDMFKSILFVVALPISIGLIVNRLCRTGADILNNICPLISALGIVFVIGIIVSLNVGNLRQCGAAVFLAVVLHNGLGMLSGYGCARLFKCDKKTSVTIAIEVGMQNSGLAAALSKEFFGIASALPGAIFSIWHNISGAVAGALFRKYIKY